MKEKEKQKGSPTPQSETTLGEGWEVAPSPFAIGSRVGLVSALQQKHCRKRTEAMERIQLEHQEKESRWVEEIPRPNTERKYMKRYKGKCDIFFGIEHRLRKEEMEEQFN